MLKREKNPKEAEKYNFIPKTFVLPREYAMFVEEFKRLNTRGAKNLWIMKPIGRSQGRGIFLIQKLSEISKWKYEFKSTLHTQQEHGCAVDSFSDKNEIETYVVQV